MFSTCKTILSISMHRKKKSIYITEKNFMFRQQQSITVLIKKRYIYASY